MLQPLAFLTIIANEFWRMLQKTFNIYPESYDDCRLFIEAGNQHIACWCKDAHTGAVKAFEFFQFDTDEKNDISGVLGEVRLYSKLMNKGMYPETVIWDTADAVCIPSVFYKEEFAGQYIEMLMGEAPGTGVLTQQVNNTVIVSRHETAYLNAFNSHFKNHTFTHKFAQLIKKFDTGTVDDVAANQVHIIFYPAHFILVALKNEQLQLMHSFNYSTSEDALYNIMQVCNQYNMPVAETSIIASGLIDTASNLYNTLYAYLDNFSLQEAGDVSFDAQVFSEYPAHYFLPFIYE